MKRGFLLFALIVLLAPISFAEVVHDEWHWYQDTFLLGEDIVDIRLASNLALLRVNVNEERLLMQEGKCEDAALYTVCFELTSFDGAVATIGDDGVLYPGVKLVIEEREGLTEENSSDQAQTPLAGKLSFDVEYNQVVMMNEPINLRLILNNTGDALLNRVSASFDIPFESTVEKGSFTRIDNKLNTNSLAIQSDDYEVFEASFTPKYPGEYDVGMTINNGSGIEKYNLSVLVNSPFIFNYSIIDPLTDPSKGTDITYELTNIGGEDLLVDDFWVGHSAALMPGPVDGFRFESRKIVGMIDKVEPGETVEMSSFFTPSRTGEFEISPYIKLTYGGVSFSANYNNTIESTIDGFSTSAEFNRETVIPGAKVDYNVRITNSNEDNSFYDFKISLSNSFLDELIEYEELKPETSETFTGSFITPAIYRNIDDPIEVEVSYKEAGGVEVSDVSEFPLKVRGNDSLFKVELSSVDAEDVSPGDTITLQVDVSNLVDMSFTRVELEDILSPGIEFVTGKRQASLALPAGESRRAYLYRVRVPEDYIYDSVAVTNVIKVSGVNYEQTFSSTIPVEGEDLVPLDFEPENSFFRDTENLDAPEYNESNYNLSDEDINESDDAVQEESGPVATSSQEGERETQGFFAWLMSILFG